MLTNRSDPIFSFFSSLWTGLSTSSPGIIKGTFLKRIQFRRSSQRLLFWFWGFGVELLRKKANRSLVVSSSLLLWKSSGGKILQWKQQSREVLKSKNSKVCEDSFLFFPLTSISQLKQVRKHLWSYLSQPGGSEQSKGLFFLVPQVELAGHAPSSRNEGGTYSSTVYLK